MRVENNNGTNTFYECVTNKTCTENNKKAVRYKRKKNGETIYEMKNIYIQRALKNTLSV